MLQDRRQVAAIHAHIVNSFAYELPMNDLERRDDRYFALFHRTLNFSGQLRHGNRS